MKKEFLEFFQDQSNTMPRSLEQSILQQIEQKINPAFKVVFIKISIIQSIAGILLIFLCPQLGVGFFEYSMLMDFFMRFGHYACTTLCGSLFLSLGVFGNWLFLTREEWLRFRKQAQFFQPLVLVLSILILSLFGAKGQFLIFFLWSLGGLLSSLSLIKFVFKDAAQGHLAF